MREGFNFQMYAPPLIKLIGLGVVPLVAAYMYGGGPSEPMLPPSYAAEEADRIFLAELQSQDTTQRERAASLARKSREEQDVRRAIPVAIPVTRIDSPASLEPEVRRAIPVAPHRASILIYHGEVSIVPASRVQ
jgi:hypothetical protein